jgi:hypothetical protein
MSIKTVTTSSKQSRTFLFMTRGGKVGLLQFLDFNESPRGWVKFRYKLVRSAAEAIDAEKYPNTDAKTKTSEPPR